MNVLFTRARKRTVVFSSLDPNLIQTNPSTAWGVKALKQYLLYARSGILEQADDGAAQPTNDFEMSVGSILKEHGYDVVPQVGVAGFFIDLAIRHPARPGAYLLGVECDGASYHSGRSARDRDRLRQEILENLGWKIHRVWSTDWFRSRDAEIGRLLKRIRLLLEADPVYIAEKTKVKKIDALRRNLISLRDNEIVPAFPNSPPQACLLTETMLDAFLQKRPTTRDEWFRRIPHELRDKADSKQVGLFLEKVLTLISEAQVG